MTSEKLIPIMTADPTVRARCAGVGILTADDAFAYGAVGPLARASGVAQDLRKSDPYEAYGTGGFRGSGASGGRRVRSDRGAGAGDPAELRLIEQAIETMPAGPIAGPLFPEVPAGEASVRIEAPRGEVFYYVASDGSDVPRGSGSARPRSRTCRRCG